MSKTNCINCGAAKDIDDIKCPFCGTTYLDFTGIDFTSGKPVVCQFVLPFMQKRTVMSMMAMPRLDDFSMTTQTLDITSLGDSWRRIIPTTPNINVSISFNPVERDGKIFTLKEVEDND